jgi:hypothetical protein
MHLGWSAGQNVRLTLEYRVRVRTLQVVQELAVAIQMIEILEQSEVEGLTDVGIGLVASQVGG